MIVDLEGDELLSAEQLEALAKLHRRIAALYVQAAALKRQPAQPAPPSDPPDEEARAAVRKKLLQKGYRVR